VSGVILKFHTSSSEVSSSCSSPSSHSDSTLSKSTLDQSFVFFIFAECARMATLASVKSNNVDFMVVDDLMRKSSFRFQISSYQGNRTTQTLQIFLRPTTEARVFDEGAK